MPLAPRRRPLLLLLRDDDNDDDDDDGGGSEAEEVEGPLLTTVVAFTNISLYLTIPKWNAAITATPAAIIKQAVKSGNAASWSVVVVVVEEKG